MNISYEIILVNDGSEDSTWSIITTLCADNKNAKGIRFTKNAGSNIAILAGLTNCKGDAAIILDCDGQHPPTLIPEMFKKWKMGYKIVNTKRQYASGALFYKKISSYIFYHLYSYLADIPLKSGYTDFVLIDRQTINVILEMDYHEFFLRGILSSLGFSAIDIPYACPDRKIGRSKYNFVKIVKYAMRVIVSYSVKPLKLGIWFGFLMSFLTLMELVYIFIQYIYGKPVEGWTSMITVITFCFSGLYFLVGIIGIYISRIYMNQQKKPKYIIAETINVIDVDKKEKRH